MEGKFIFHRKKIDISKNDKDTTKITWVKWGNILVSREKDRLGIGSLKAFNQALLQKWRWRLQSNLNQLWVYVIKSIYGEDAGFDHIPSTAKGTWRNIVGSINHLHDCCIVPKDTLKHKVGCGTKESLQTELQHVTPFEGQDEVCWGIGHDGKFPVGATRLHIDDAILPTLDVSTMWCKILPKKGNIFLWRLNLDRSASVKSFKKRVGNPINLMSDWKSWFDNLHLSNDGKSRLQVIAATVWWTIWKYRNSVTFNS
nr:RNA-directed DNA polymerase, eukaryota, reverse transcriptase zinc-binding domain protein [Tanacetum cinerariifolium]